MRRPHWPPPFVPNAWASPPPTDTEPRHHLYVAATARTGSNLLGSLLRSSGAAGYPTEWFHPIKLEEVRRETGHPRPTIRGELGRVRRRLRGDRRWNLTASYAGRELRLYLRHVQQRSTADNGVWGTKLMWDQFTEVITRNGLDLNPAGLPETWVWTRRDDQVAQACSHYRALATDQWVEQGEKAAPPPYDADGIAAALDFVRRCDAAWAGWFAANDIDPMILTYESIAADPLAAAGAVLDRLGVTPTGPLATTMRKQGDATNDEWIARFHTDRPDLVQP